MVYMARTLAPPTGGKVELTWKNTFIQFIKINDCGHAEAECKVKSSWWIDSVLFVYMYKFLSEWLSVSVWFSVCACLWVCFMFVSVCACMWVCMCMRHKVTPNYSFEGSSCLISSWRSFFTDALTFSSFQYFSGIIPENRFKGERCLHLLCVSWCSLFCSSSLSPRLGGSEVTLDTSSVGEGLQLAKSISRLSAGLFLGYSLLTCCTDPSVSSESAVYSLSVGDNEALLRLGVHFPILSCTACVSLFSVFCLEELLSSSLEEADRQGDLKYFM